MISLCCPTRGRPARFQRMLTSARKTAVTEFEVVALLDDDDDPARYPEDPAVRYGSGPREYIDGVLCTSGLWTKAWEMASGDIAMLAADDIVFRSPGWDARVEEAFAAVPDRILMVYPDDGTRRKAPVNPFVSREWIQAVGEFTPSGWQGWMADEWVWSLAVELRRVVFLDDVLIAHLQRGGSDPTYRDGRKAREMVGGLEGMRARFYSPEMTARRDEQTARLRAVMDTAVEFVPDPVPAWFVESLVGSRAGREAMSG
jgi:hypothetical protein